MEHAEHTYQSIVHSIVCKQTNFTISLAINHIVLCARELYTAVDINVLLYTFYTVAQPHFDDTLT